MTDVQEILDRVAEAGLLWNGEPERFGTLMGEAQKLLVELNLQRDSYLQNLERENVKLKAEIERLEKCIEDFDDLARCEECQGVWDCDELTTVNGDNYCPRCVEQARAEDAYEEQADEDIDSDYRATRTNNMRAAG